MRLRTRVLIGSGAVVTSLVAGLAIYGWALPGLSRLSQESMLATRLKLGSQQLDSLVHEYLIEGNPRARQQLDIQLADLAQMSLQAIPLAGNPLREAMASEQARTVRLLDEIERRRLESTNWMSQILGEARLRHLFEQAIISSRELHDLSREWKADVDRRREVLVITAGLAVGGILLGTLALLVAGLAMLLRTVVRPVERLRAGVAAIAKGDYSHRITDAAIRHEVGLLVSDFNGMAEQLQRAEETRLRAAEREREAAIITRVNEGLERFTTHASHDLQAPLRTITCFGELLQRRLGDTLQSPDREHLQRMVEAAVRMSATIDGFLRFARAGEVDVTADTAIDPTLAAHEALANLEHIISESATLVSVQPHLPMVRCDHPQLVQIFQNLIGNAVKYRDPEHHARIEISAEIGEAMATITVQDDGPGIPIEHRSRIFGMFERINSHRAAGNGIGLAICQRIVAARGGHIWVDDGPGKGACFRFTLPRAG